eukprot:4372253-Amphidinium_carterae.2
MIQLQLFHVTVSFAMYVSQTEHLLPWPGKYVSFAMSQAKRVGHAHVNTQSGSRGLFLKIGKIGLPAAPVDPDAAVSTHPVQPDSAGAVSRLPDSSAVVSRLPHFTVLARRKKPPVASPAGVRRSSLLPQFQR